MGFCHLHCHSEFSVLDGMGKVEELVKRAIELGQPSLAITDHGSTSALWEAQKIEEKYKDQINIVKGTEFYTNGIDVGKNEKQKNGHLIVLAMNDKGLENIFKLQEYASVHNFYRKPRIDDDMLFAHNEGLIVLSACLSGDVSQYIIKGDMGKAIETARKYKQVFGDRYYLELQPNNIPIQVTVNKALVKIANQLNIQLVATNDVHYVLEEDWYPHEVMLALQSNKKWNDPKRFRFDVQDFWLKSEEEMRDGLKYLGDDVVNTSISNTITISNRCKSHINAGRYIPHFHGCEEEEERELLVDTVKEGIKSNDYSKYTKDIQHEIDVIDRNGYSGYFLIVADYVNYARKNGMVVGDGRGSGVGSKVAYVTNITKVDPEPYNLLFERFMADGREPDFDVDFSDQEAVIQYLCDVYGEENVARIIAFGTMTPKAVSRKVLSCFGASQPEIKKFNSFIRDDDEYIENALEREPQFLKLSKKYETEIELIKKLQNRISHESQHAGGVVIWKGLSSILPVKTIGANRNRRIVAFDKYMLEEIGHQKFDVLGLKTIEVVAECIKSIKESKGEEINLHEIDYEDKNIYDMLSAGDVSGVFQIAEQSAKVMEQKPQSFRDLIAINALIRPGVGDWNEYIARRNGKEWYVHPDRQKYLSETQGTMTYQEQFLLDCKTFAGWGIAYADKHIRKNKDIRNDVELKDKFITDGINNGYHKSLITAIWNEIEGAVDGGYSFNKAHSTSYAMTSYQTAWLKHYYPNHWYATLMTKESQEQDGQAKVASLIAECKGKGIKILPPDINKSDEKFRATDDGIRYRITTIKGVGDKAITSINKLKPFKSFDDLMERRVKKYINKTCVRALVKAGAFDSFGESRDELLWKYDMAQRNKTDTKNGVETERYKYNERIKAEWEKEVLGMYLSTHPMERYGFKPIDDVPDKSSVLVGGEIIKKYAFKDKNGNDMAFVWLDTLFGVTKVIVFKSQFNLPEIKGFLDLDSIIMVRGTKSGNDVILNTLEVLEDA